MIFTKISTQGTRKSFGELEVLMQSLDFVRWTWDYEKVIYDKKYVTSDGRTYYLRLRGNVISSKKLEHPEAQLELEHPVFVEHFFPHGLDDTIDVPGVLAEEIAHTLERLQKLLLN